MKKSTSVAALHHSTCGACGKACHYRPSSPAPLASAYWVHDDTGSHLGADGHDVNTHVIRPARPNRAQTRKAQP